VSGRVVTPRCVGFARLPAGRYTLKIYKQDASSMALPTEGTPVDAGATNVRLR
jgi:hypothetical protein